MLNRAFISLFVLAGLTTSCAEQSVPAPVLAEVCQSESDAVCIPHAFAGTATELTLLGHHFYQVYEVDLGNEEDPEKLGGFGAWMEEAPIDQLHIESRRIRGYEALSGELQGVLAIGTYDVEMETPSGQRARLQDAFLIDNPLLVDAHPEVARTPRAHTILLSVILENLGTPPLTEITLSLSQEGSGGFILPEPATSLVVEGGAVRKVDLELQADRLGQVSVMLEARALANGNVVVGPESPVQIDLTVLREASLVVSASVHPPVAAPGERFELVADISCRGETPALEVGLQALDLTGTGTVEMDPPPPEKQDIPAGSRRVFLWAGSATGSGTVEVTLQASGIEAISGRELGPTSADPIVLEIQ
jgi:hypothetical protein